MRFVSIDFETATYARNSACSVGVVTVDAGVVIDEYYSLIKPPDMNFNAQNIQIHGITPAMVKDAPTFEDIWCELRPRLEQRVIFAHNANFDMNVLKDTLAYYSLPKSTLWYACSLALARKVWPKLDSHKLNYMAEFLHVDLKHHNALQDAHACAQIVLQSKVALECVDLRAVANKVDLKISKMELG